MQSDSRDGTLETRTPEASPSAFQQVFSVELREIRVESPGAGSPSQIADARSQVRTATLPGAPSQIGRSPQMNAFAVTIRNGAAALGFADRSLTCVDCGAEFVFTADEQAFFHERGFKNEPKRCKRCSAKRHHRPLRPCHEVRVTCAECATETTVPFKPRNGKPVLCRICFARAKQLPVAG